MTPCVKSYRNIRGILLLLFPALQITSATSSSWSTPVKKKKKKNAASSCKHFRQTESHLTGKELYNT